MPQDEPQPFLPGAQEPPAPTVQFPTYHAGLVLSEWGAHETFHDGLVLSRWSQELPRNMSGEAVPRGPR